MIIKKILITTGIVLFTFVSSAQWRSVSMVDDHTVHRIDDGTNITYTLFNRLSDKETILGTEYINDSFQEATINNGNTIYKLRYNNFTGFFEHEQKNNDILSISKVQNKEINFKNGTKYVLKSIPIGKTHTDEYLQLVRQNNANIPLYVFNKIIFFEGKTGKNSYEKSSQPEFKKEKPIHFIEIENNMYAIKKSSDLTKIFPEYKSTINEYVKSNSIKFESVQDIIKLLELIK